MGNGEEKRTCPRAAIELEVEYRRVNMFFQDYTQNISKGGTFIRTQKPLDVGTEFLFRLKVPLLEDPLELNGVVRWVNADDAGGKPVGMGIEFLYRDDGERSRVEDAVEQLFVDQLGPRAYEKLVGKR